MGKNWVPSAPHSWPFAPTLQARNCMKQPQEEAKIIFLKKKLQLFKNSPGKILVKMNWKFKGFNSDIAALWEEKENKASQHLLEASWSSAALVLMAQWRDKRKVGGFEFGPLGLIQSSRRYGGAKPGWLPFPQRTKIKAMVVLCFGIRLPPSPAPQTMCHCVKIDKIIYISI